MKKIFARTFETTLKLVNIIIVCAISIICALIVINAYGNSEETEAFSVLLNNVVTLQNLIFFFCLTGILLMVMTISSFTGLIATEVHEGTIKLLAAKSNSRTEILVGKILGAFTGTVCLLILSILAYFATLAISNAFDKNIMFELSKYIPSYFLYGLIIIINIGALSTILSCIFKKKVIALLPMLAFCILIYAFYPMARVTTDLIGTGSGTIATIFDFNYQYASIFKACLSIKGPIEGSATQLTIYSYFTKLFVTKIVDQDISGSSYEQLIVENNVFNCYGVLVSYIILSIGCYIGSIHIFKKKDL